MSRAKHTQIEILRLVTSGKNGAHLHPVEVRSEEVSYHNKTCTFNKVYLLKASYEVGWIMDNDVSACMSCDVVFNILKRKHHCRACGVIICDGCCHNRHQIPSLLVQEKKLSRVCDSCHEAKSAKATLPDVEERKEPMEDEIAPEKMTPIEIENAALAKNLEDVCDGKVLAANDRSVEVKVEECTLDGKKRFFNKAFLADHKYKVGWVLYREFNKCMVCKYDFVVNSNASKSHCRLCGIILCSSCSTNRFLVPVLPEANGSKVCERCHGRALKFKSSATTAATVSDTSSSESQWEQDERAKSTADFNSRLMSKADSPRSKSTLGDAKPTSFLDRIKKMNASLKK